MKTSFILFCLTFACGLSLSAQDTTWFDSEWKDCSRAEAMYYHLEHTEGDITHFKDYYKANNQVQNSGQYRDGEKFGLFVWYDENGLKTSGAEYVDQNNDGELDKVLKFYNDKGEEVPGLVIGKADEFPDPTLVEGEKYLEKDPDPDALVFVEREPIPMNLGEVKQAIGYPIMAVEAEIEGKVVVRVLVGKTGKYERHIVLRKGHQILNKAVERQLPNLIFKPGLVGGKPLKVWVTMPFDFKLIRPKVGEEE